MNKGMVLLVIVLGILSVMNFSFAGELRQVELVGNKLCPITGEKVDSKMPAMYEYKGKVYNFCCYDCVEDFKDDPERYIKKLESMGKKAKGTPKKVIMVDNKYCPIGGSEIEPEYKALCEYKGKVYSFCSEVCVEEFQQSPQKYLKKLPALEKPRE